MTAFNYIALPSHVADLVRATGRSPGYGHPAYSELATGYGPCRHCLRTFQVGDERRTLFTYDPFHELEPLPLPGPIFIHADPCARYPETAGFPDDLRAHALTLVAYADDRRVVEEAPVTDGGVERVLERLFAGGDVRYVHVRDRSAGCYDLRVERANATEAA